MCSLQVDFTKPDPSRPLEIKCGNRSIFIDPEWAQDVSPFLTNFFVRELVAGEFFFSLFIDILPRS